MEKKNNRNITIDIMRGTMILFVVIYHLIYREQGGVADRTIREMIYLVLPLFFVFSGYFYKKQNPNIWSDVLHKIKTLLFPAILTMTVLLICFGPYYMLVYDGYTAKSWLSDTLLTFLRPEFMERFVPQYSSPGQLFNNLSPVWFIWVMAWASLIFYIVVRFVYNNTLKMIIVALALITLGSVLYVNVPAMSWSLHITPIYAGLMLLGTVLRKYNIVEKLCKQNLILSLCLAVIAGFLHFLIFDSFGSDLLYMSILGEFTYLAAMLFIIQTFIGGFALLTVARLIALFKPGEKAFAWIGRHTMIILFYHCLIGGIVADALQTFNKPGPNWYLDPLKSETVIKSFISFFVSLLGCFCIATINDRIKNKNRVD